MVKRKKQNEPPKNLFRDKSCSGKKKYSSEAEALDMLEIQKSYGKPVDDIRPYRCGFCGKWHLGHAFKY